MPPQENLDSRCAASVVAEGNGTFSLYIRGDYEENLGMWSFVRWRLAFKTEVEAMLFYKKNWPQGVIIPFDSLTTAQI